MEKTTENDRAGTPSRGHVGRKVPDVFLEEILARVEKILRAKDSPVEEKAFDDLLNDARAKRINLDAFSAELSYDPLLQEHLNERARHGRSVVEELAKNPDTTLTMEGRDRKVLRAFYYYLQEMLEDPSATLKRGGIQDFRDRVLLRKQRILTAEDIQSCSKMVEIYLIGISIKGQLAIRKIHAEKPEEQAKLPKNPDPDTEIVADPAFRKKIRTEIAKIFKAKDKGDVSLAEDLFMSSVEELKTNRVFLNVFFTFLPDKEKNARKLMRLTECTGLPLESEELVPMAAACQKFYELVRQRRISFGQAKDEVFKLDATDRKALLTQISICRLTGSIEPFATAMGYTGSGFLFYRTLETYHRERFDGLLTFKMGKGALEKSLGGEEMEHTNVLWVALQKALNEV